MSADERIKRVTDAKRQIVEGSLTIWNTRLDMLNQAGDIRGIHDLLTRSVEAAEGDNCGNNCNCGSSEMESRTLPGSTAGPRAK